MNATRGRAALARSSTASLIGEPPYSICSSELRSRKRTAGWSATIWIMVGTRVVSVTFCCSIASNTVSGRERLDDYAGPAAQKQGIHSGAVRHMEHGCNGLVKAALIIATLSSCASVLRILAVVHAVETATSRLPRV